MKQQRWNVKRLLSIILCLFMAFHPPVAASAEGYQSQEPQINRQPLHVRLGSDGKLTKLPDNYVPTQPPAALLADDSASPLETAVMTLMTEDFEGNFPEDNSWMLLDQDGATNGEYLWDDTTYRYYQGSKSGWVAAGGADGFQPTSANHVYPAPLTTVMIYGPFNLQNATAATLTLRYWGQVAFGHGLGVLASTDNDEYNGFTVGGTSGWVEDSLDLAHVDGSSLSYLGQPQVWIMIGFQATSANTSSREGFYVDNMVLTADYTTPPVCYTLSTAADPGGTGSVEATPAPNCNGTQYAQGTVVSLRANPSTGYAFSSWSGDASGASNPTSVTMNADRSVTANFVTACYTLTTSASPGSSGSVSANPAPNCNDTQYTHGTSVTLTANPAQHYTFGSWSGDAAGTTSPVTIAMNSPKSVTANFSPVCYTLTTGVSPSGSGSVTVNTPQNCSGGYTYNTSVSITANPDPGYSFSSWTGVSGDATTTVTMNANQTVTANFAQNCYTLTTGVNPSGSGSVTVATANNCSGGYTHGTVVSITAVPGSTYDFVNWSGAASGTSLTTTVTMDADKTVTANFTLQCYTLSISENPTDGGTVTANPAPNCTDGNRYTHGTTVTLTANPAAGYNFTAWSGDASGTNTTTTVSITAAKTVTATFTIKCYTLTTAVSPNDSGSVSATPGPNCGTQYRHGTNVQLTASPHGGYNFSSWSGDLDNSINPVTITMDGPKNITANFTQRCYTLSTAVSPNGTGSITQNPTPNCNGGTQYAEGTQVQLTASPSTGYAFSLWTGDASGTTNPVTVTMTADSAVTANFIAAHPLPVLSALNPSKIFSKSSDTILILTGTGFIPESAVRWNGTSLAGVQYVSSTELRVTIPASLLLTSATVPIDVVNPGPGGGTSNALELTIDPQLDIQIKIFLPFTTR